MLGGKKKDSCMCYLGVSMETGNPPNCLTCRHPIRRLRRLDADSDLTNLTLASQLSVFNLKTRETRPESKSIKKLAIFFQILATFC